MADNTTLNTGSGGDTLRTEDRTTFKTPVSIIDQGAAGGSESLVDSTNPLYTQLRSEVVDDAAFTPATSRVVMVGAEFDNTTPDSVDEGDGGALRMSANRSLYVNIRDNAGNERGLAVDANGAIAVTGAGGTQYAIDAVAGAADTGTLALAVRDDSLATLTPADGDYTQLRTDSTGRLWCNVSNTVTVGAHDVTNSGTFAVQAAQSGTWNITTCSTVTTVTGLTAITTSVTPGTSAAHLGKAEDAAHSSGDTGVFMLAVRSDTAAATGTTDGDYSALVVDSTGRLHVNVGNTITVASHAVTNAGTFAVQATCTNAGTFAVQVDGSALTALQLLDDAVFTDDAAFTPATSKVFAIGMQADEASTDSVDEGDIGCPRMTLDRKQLTVAQVHTAGGASIFRTLDLDETEEEVKATAGQVYGYYVYNAAASVRYVKFYNLTAANTTVGTSTPVLTLPIPATTAGHTNFPFGVVFDTAITVACTTGLADNDTGAPSASDVVLNVYFK